MSESGYIYHKGFTLEERRETFWSLVDKGGPVPEHCPELGPCWLWKGYIMKSTGYGRFYYNKKGYQAHRFCWFLVHGEWPTLPYVCHACDNRLCVNPDHHFNGTAKDNNDDMTVKGRANRIGWPATLTVKQVLAIRLLWETGKFSEQDIAEITHTTRKQVESARYKWRNLNAET